MTDTPARPFWETTPLERMTPSQWESLCDGCGQCCMHRFEDDATGAYFVTNAACRLLDLHTCKCKHYETRRKFVPGCMTLTLKRVRKYDWLPETCAYRRLAAGKELPTWHPLITGDPESVHAAGVSVRGKAVSEDDVDLEAIEASL